MFDAISLKTKLIAGGLVILILVLGFLALKNSYIEQGRLACQAENIAAQAAHDTKVKQSFRKIKNAAPSDDDDAGVADFLRARTTRY